jgi:hypothetical protein
MNTIKNITSSHDLLVSFDTGMGKTVDLASIASLSDGKLTYMQDTVNVSQAWQEAYLLMMLHRNIKDLGEAKRKETLELFASNRLSFNHTDGSTTVKAPVLPGHVMTAASFEKQSFETMLDMWEVVQALRTIKDSMSKADILKAIADAIALPEDRLAAIAEAYSKEKAIHDAKCVLTQYLDAVTIINDKSLSGYVRPELTSDEQDELRALTSTAGAFPMVGTPTLVPAVYKVEGFVSVMQSPQRVQVTIKLA